MTIRDTLATDTISRLDAELLLAAVLDCRREDLLADDMRELSEAELACFTEFVSWRANGQPVAQIIGKKEFYGLDFAVDEAVLTPRPETEMLVEQALQALPDGRGSILEIGTGTGCVAISLKKNAPDLQITATDISQAALDTAQHNAAQHIVEIDFQQRDLLDGMEGDFDIMLANLPYIAEDDAELEPAVRAHEPATALFADEDGLALIRQLLEQIAARDAQPRLILLEHGARQGAATREIATRLFPRAVVETLPDLAGLDRVLKIQLN